MIEEKLKDILGKEVTIGFGSSNERVVLLCDKEGITFYASEKGIEIGEKEDIKTKITPEKIRCEKYNIIKNLSIWFKLGHHRFLNIGYINDNKGINLRVVYLPDEKDLEYGTSEFMNKCGSRGLI